MMERNSENGGGWARRCDSCQSAACTVYCRADSAYLCAGCDSRIHAANPVASRHERVWVCEVCESAAASITCKADAAALCAACDTNIHSANRLARRHHRVPIQPIPSDNLFGASHPGIIRPVCHGGDAWEDGFAREEEADRRAEDEAASWLVLNPAGKKNNQSHGFFYGGEVDEFLDLVEYNSCGENNSPYHDHHQCNQQQKQSHGKNDGSDSVVPVKSCGGNEHLQQQHKNLHEGSNTDFSYTASLGHSVS